ncbi:hypothetical protein LIA77_05933 [Sarocladium implicatum]|nr:hypothetical protein LIA77_05933 [Sarocladium implicatum]
MSSPHNNDTGSGSPGAGQDEKPRLTEEEKKQNHIASGLEGQGRSEGLVLKRTVEFMREQIAERQLLVNQVEGAGGDVDDDLKKPLTKKGKGD